MRLILADRETGSTAREIFNQKIVAKHATPRKAGQRWDRLGISKHGRLVEIEFTGLGVAGAQIGHLTFTEAEILLLAKLCRRNRSDAEFLQAIDDAGKGISEIRKTRRTARGKASVAPS